MYLLSAIATLADGTEAPGFLTPTQNDPDLGLLQPYVFAGASAFGFWGGMFGVADEYRDRFHTQLGKDDVAVFPLSVTALPGLSKGLTHVAVPGWVSMASAKPTPSRPSRGFLAWLRRRR